MLRIAVAIVGLVAVSSTTASAQGASRCAGLGEGAALEGEWSPYVGGDVMAVASDLFFCDGEREHVALRVDAGARVLVQHRDPRTDRVAVLVRLADGSGALWLASPHAPPIACAGPPTPVSAIEARWSPGGTLVLHFSSGSDTSETFVCHPDGTTGWIGGAAETRVSPNAAFVVAFTPVGSPDRSDRLVVYSVESGRPVVSSSEPDQAHGLVWGRGAVRVRTAAGERALSLPRRWP